MQTLIISVRSCVCHRDDVLMADTPSLDYGNQKVNSNDVSAAYQKHLLQGIRWALGLVGSDSKL